MRIDKLCATSMLLAIAFLLYGGLFGHFAPAPLPTDSVEKVAVFYRQYNHQILIFAFFNCVSTTLFLPAFCALSAAMLRMQPRNVTLAMVQLTGGIVATVGPFLGSMFLAAAVVRPDASPHVIATLNDLTVIFIELSTLPVLFQGLSLALATFRDRSPDPVLPVWFGYVSLIWGVMAQGGMFAIFFRSGPLSSTGLIGVVLPIATMIIWMAATTFVLFRMKPHLGLAAAPL